MQDRYGVDLRVDGRSTFAVLPVPRVKFEEVTLRLPNKALVAEGGTLRGELRLLPLVFGRIELSDIALSEARLSGSHQALHSMDWDEIFENRPSAAHARRLIVTNSSLKWTDLKNADLDQVNLVVSWGVSDDPLRASGSVRWRNEKVSLDRLSIHPDLLAAGQISPASLTLSAPSGRIVLTGDAQFGSALRFKGEGKIEAKSVRDFTRWSDLKLPFGPLVQSLSVSGGFSMDHRRLSWPSAAVALGEDKLEGTVSVRLDTERPVISGTLAADTLNLSELFAPFAQARTRSGNWSEDVIDLANVTGHDLDLRLSATTAQIGRLRLDDMAANVLVRPGQVEASIGRAGFHDGTLKGRLSLSAVGGTAVEIKSQGSFNKVDLAPFLSTMGEPHWITGQAQGQFQFEGSGRNPAEVARRAQGRFTAEITDGSLVGLSLEDALKRIEKQPLLASLSWKGGRTPFEKAQVQLAIKDGVGEIVQGRLTTPALLASLQGQVLLADRSLDLKADISSADVSSEPVPLITFDIGGKWDNVIVVPDARSLIERSEAAKFLFRSHEPPLEESRPLATAQ